MIRYDLYNSIDSALNESNYEERFNSLGSSIGQTISKSLKENLMNSDAYLSAMQGVEKMLDNYVMGEAINIAGISSIALELQRITAQTEMDALKLESVMSLFDVGSTDYINQAQNIQYSASSSTTQQYVFNNSVNTNIGNMISNTDKTALTSFANLIAPYVVTAVKENLNKKIG